MSSSYYMQHMLLQYGRQLTTARRIARHRQAMRLAGGEESTLPVEARRKLMVERITGEIVENLLLSGSESPIVQELRERLSEALGEELLFRYPPGELEIRIFRKKNDAHEEILGEEKARIMHLLWKTAGEIVDATML